MQKSLLLISVFFLSACSTFEKTDLLGSWKTTQVHSEMNVQGFEGASFKFNKDDTFIFETTEGQLKGIFHWWGNTLHLVNDENIDWPISVHELTSTELKLELTRADIPVSITLQKTD